MDLYYWERKRAEMVDERVQELTRCNPAVDSPDNYNHRNAANLREYLSECSDEDVTELTLRFEEFYKTRSQAALASIGNALFYNSQEWLEAKALERVEDEIPSVMELDYAARMESSIARYEANKDESKFEK